MRSTMDVQVSNPEPTRLLTGGIAVFLTLLFVFATWPPGMHIDLFEHGHWLGPLEGMLRGRLPYRDILPIHGFLADGGLDFFASRFSAPTFAASIWMRQAIGSLFQPAVFLVGAAATRRPLLAAALVPVGLFFANGLVFDRAVLPLIGLAVFLYAIDTKPRRVVAGIAGVLAGAALLLAGALGSFLEVSLRDLPAAIGNVWGLRFPRPWETAGPGQAIRLSAVPITTALALIVIGRAARAVDPAKLWRGLALLIANVFFFRYVFGRLHFEAGNALAVPTLAAAAVVWRERRRDPAGRFAPAAAVAVGALALALGLPPLARLLGSAIQFQRRVSVCPGCVRLTARRGGRAMVPAEEAEKLLRLCEAIEELAPKGPLLDLSNRPALYFFLDRVNPTRFYQVPMMEPFQDEVIRDLERDPPSLVLLSSGTAFDAFDGRPNPDRIPRIWTFVTARYPRRVLFDGNVLALPAPTGR
jgi:hypothetical protein